MTFHNRRHAGQVLAQELRAYKKDDSIVLGLPRGGVPVAKEISDFLGAPLDVLIVRKIGAPFQSELAVGAICEGEEPIWNNSILCHLGFEPDDLGKTVSAERERVRRQLALFRESRRFPSVAHKTVIVVDDGLATGATMSAAIRHLKKKGAAKIVVAVPVAAASAAANLRKKVDEVFVVDEQESLGSVGSWYEDFSQVSDEEVVELLRKSPSTPEKNQNDINCS